MNKKDTYGTQSSGFQVLKTFSTDIIKTVSVINTTVKCNDWIGRDVKFTVAEDGNWRIIGLDLFRQLGLSINQLKQILNINQNQYSVEQKVALDFPALISRIGKSLKHTVKSTFHKNFTPTHRKGNQVQINIQPSVKAAIYVNSAPQNCPSDIFHSSH